MKKLLSIVLFGLLCLASVDSYAQGLYRPDADASTSGTQGFVLGDTSRVVKIYGPFNGFDVNSVTLGVYYTKGASEDSTTTVQLLHALDATAINAGYGEVISTDATLQFVHGAASEYQEEVITRSGIKGYLGIKIVPVGTATDTTTIEPFLYVDN